MRKPKKPKHFLKTPQYPGGNAALTRYVDENLRYPKEALEKRVEGTVEVEYFVNGLGDVTKVNILKGLGYGCDEEVERLVRSLVFEKAINRGMKTSTRKTLKVHFKLPTPKQTSVKYNLVKEAPKKEAPAKKSGSYNITITYKKR